MRLRMNGYYLIYLLLMLLSMANMNGVAIASFSSSSFKRNYIRPIIYSSNLRQTSRLVGDATKLFSNKSGDPFTLVIVESPAKAKTIAKYLNSGDDGILYEVEASMGHVRDLPQKAKHTNFLPEKYQTSKWSSLGIDLDSPAFDPMYIVLPDKIQTVKRLQEISSKADEVVLATDEDREGEAIAFHLAELLKPNVFKRVTFTEITKDHIKEQMLHPRDIDYNLVNAQECRRLFDRLAGYQMSPTLWKKIAPGLSAGRVQTCALYLIVQREMARLKFISSKYNSIEAAFKFGDAKLTTINGTKVASSSDFGQDGSCSNSTIHLTNEIAYIYLEKLSLSKEFKVKNVTSSLRRTKPPKPFITSTLQRECSSKLGFSVSDTMRGAQMLYESGYITYMRTDSDILSDDAIHLACKTVENLFGSDYVRCNDIQGSKGAHEPIRPAMIEGEFVKPEHLSRHCIENGYNFSPRLIQLYELIYKRTLASVMTDIVTNITALSLVSCDVNADFRLSTSLVVDKGFSAIYGDSDDEKEIQCFDSFDIGDIVIAKNITVYEHTTSPPSRYSEASFVKELEELGVGRPSTYAQIIQTLKSRAYVQVSSRFGSKNMNSVAKRASGIVDSKVGRHTLAPTLTSLAVCSLLSQYAPLFVDTGFTADLEKQLDFIASNQGTDRSPFLSEYHKKLNVLVDQVLTAPGNTARRAALPILENSNVEVLVGPWGPFVQRIEQLEGKGIEKSEPQTIPLPSDLATNWTRITPTLLNGLLDLKYNDQTPLGIDPDTNLPLFYKVARYGPYLQLGTKGDVGYKTQSLPQDCSPTNDLFSDDQNLCPITFDDALQYINLPRYLGEYNGTDVTAGFGAYGPYIKYNTTYVSLPKDMQLMSVTIDDVEKLIEDSLIKSKLGRGILAELGTMEGSSVTVRDGRFGKYIKWNRINAKLPLDYDEYPAELPLAEAWSLIQEKLQKAGNINESKKKQVKYVAKLPPAPKAPQSAYLRFCSEMRPLVKENVSSFGEVSKELSRLWAETEDRSKWMKLAESDKIVYEQEKKEWKDECNRLKMKDKKSVKSVQGGIFSLETKKGQKRFDLPPAPKRPLSAYFHFAAEMRPLVKSKASTVGEVSKLIGKMWEDTEDKTKWGELAEVGKKKYEEDRKKWKDECNRLMNGNQKAVSSIESKNRSISKPSSPRKDIQNGLVELPPAPKRPLSAYFHFAAEMRPLVKSKASTVGEVSKLIGKMWEDTEDKTKWGELAEVGKKKYEEDRKKWKDECNRLLAKSK